MVTVQIYRIDVRTGGNPLKKCIINAKPIYVLGVQTNGKIAKRFHDFRLELPNTSFHGQRHGNSGAELLDSLVLLQEVVGLERGWRIGEFYGCILKGFYKFWLPYHLHLVAVVVTLSKEVQQNREIGKD
jgi:hypothetical protein